MKYTYTLVLWLVSAIAAFAQVPELPAPTPLPTGFRNGSYQSLSSDNWQTAKLSYNAVPELLVQDADHKASDPLVLPAKQVRAFIIGRDTFDVVHDLTLPGAQPIPAAFARRLFRGGGYQVYEYVMYRYKPEPPVAYRLLLDRPGGRIVAVLPLTPRQFRLALAPAVRDFQALSTQLELDPNILPVQLPELLSAYAHWKQTHTEAITAK